MKIPQNKIILFQEKVLSWYSEHKRDLPWRRTLNPYHIHVSEIMLAQTQVERVKKYYFDFLEKYPKLEDLAQAQKKDLFEMWQGLGYNNRVLRLQLSAQKILEEFDGKYPESLKELESLPGVGPYTSSAIMAFAFNKEVGVVDTNIRRVLIYELNLDEEISDKDLREVALMCVPKNLSCDWNNALMDYGSLVLTPQKTGIESRGKQSKFVGSTRWVRSQILQRLLAGEELSLDIIKNDYLDLDHDFEKIIFKMQQDGILVVENSILKLSN